jgi:predicted anti-sigma-YlaC factor YlaD
VAWLKPDTTDTAPECSAFRQWLSETLDSVSMLPRISEHPHPTGCRSCQQYVASGGLLAEYLAQQTAPAVNLTERILLKCRKELPVPRRAGRRRISLSLGGFAFLLLVLLGIGLTSRRAPELPAGPVVQVPPKAIPSTSPQPDPVTAHLVEARSALVNLAKKTTPSPLAPRLPTFKEPVEKGPLLTASVSRSPLQPIAADTRKAWKLLTQDFRAATLSP